MAGIQESPIKKVDDDHFVEMHHITKLFPGTLALDDVNFQLGKGEIHALIGENGAGKSTLIKILTGIYEADSGEIFLDKQRTIIKNPKMARQSGISVVFQEFNLIPNLTVVENLFLSMEKITGRYFLKRKEMYRESKSVLEKVNLGIDPLRKVSSLSVAEQQLVEIAKALLTKAQILILDEPTAVLSTQEVINLFQIMHEFKNEGKSIIFVSHRLDEILEISDYITVLKDGKNVDTVKNDNIEKSRLISLMVGKEFKDIFIQSERTPRDEVLLDVRGLSVKNKIFDVSFQVKAGEIVALGGLEGHGQRTILEALFGLHKYEGNVLLRGRELRINTPGDSLKQGIMMITDDRKGEGLCLDLSVLYNMEILGYHKFCSKLGIIQRSAELKLASKSVEEHGIKTPSVSQNVKFLSGGNQQKILISRIDYLPKVNLLLFKELTRGIDVGAKIEIYRLLHQMACEIVENTQMGILFYSSDFFEVLGLSDRIIGIYDGRITTVLENKDLNEEKLMSEIIKGSRA